MDSKMSRRIRVDLRTTTEKLIADAHAAVEAMPADVRLTNACIKLMEAQDLVASYINEQLRGVSID